jgi:hypothetical protein
MTTRFEATGVLVLRFSYAADRAGDVLPPEAHATFKDRVWVHFDRGNGVEDVVGRAKLYRKGDELLADLELVSSMPDPQEALKLISELIPAICGKVLDSHNRTVLKLEITSVALGHGNADRHVPKIGNRLRIAAGKGLQ